MSAGGDWLRFLAAALMEGIVPACSLLAMGWLAWHSRREYAAAPARWLNRVAPLAIDPMAAGAGLAFLCAFAFALGPAEARAGALVAFAVSCAAAGVDPVEALGLARGGLRLWCIRPVTVYFAMFLPLELLVVLCRASFGAAGAGFDEQPVMRQLREASDPGTRQAFLLNAVLLAPVYEEFIFRGALYGWLKSRMPMGAAMAVSALAFGAAHQHAPYFLPLAFLGAVLVFVYESTGTIWSAVVLHALFNGVTVFFTWMRET